MRMPFVASLALAALSTPLVSAQTTPTAADLQPLRQQIDALRAEYEARLQDLERRLQQAEAARAAPPAPAAQPVSPARTAAPAGALAQGFNPAISLILSGTYTHTSKDPETYTLARIPMPQDAEVGPGERGFSLAESELGLAATIDPWWRGRATLALHPDDSVSVEEAYVQTTSLGQGFTLKAGRFLSGIGYLNEQHAHTWDFIDNPLAYQALLGTQLGDDGLQLKWLAPTDLFVELGAEIGRGKGFPGGDNARHGAGTAALSLHLGGDLGSQHSWRAGLSGLDAKAREQALLATGSGGDPVEAAFDGRTRLWVADAVWQWAPDGNPSRSHLKLQAEYLRSTRRGTMTHDPAGAGPSADYRAVMSGWYLQGVFQVNPRWRLGLRTEQLDSGRPDYGANATLFATGRERARKDSVLLEHRFSEFSRLRLQLADDRARPGESDRQLMLQYQMSLGAHGAHGF